MSDLIVSITVVVLALFGSVEVARKLSRFLYRVSIRAFPGYWTVNEKGWSGALLYGVLFDFFYLSRINKKITRTLRKNG